MGETRRWHYTRLQREDYDMELRDHVERNGSLTIAFSVREEWSRAVRAGVAALAKTRRNQIGVDLCDDDAGPWVTW